MQPYELRIHSRDEAPNYRAMVASSGHRFSDQPKAPGQRKKAKAKRRAAKAGKRASR